MRWRSVCKCGAVLLYGGTHINCPWRGPLFLRREDEQRPVAKPRVRLQVYDATLACQYRVLVVRPAAPSERTAFPMVPLAWTHWCGSARAAWAEACRANGIVNQRTGNSTWDGW